MNVVVKYGYCVDGGRFYLKLFALCLVLFAAAPLYGQSEVIATSQRTVSYGAASAPAQAGYTSDSQSQNPYLGGVPTGTTSPTALSLSLEDAVARGLRQNLGGLLSTDAVSGARGERWQTLSALLPNLTTATSLGVRQTDLKATIGITVPGHPPVIGPFGVFDTRAYLDQTLFNWESIERARSSTAQLKSAQYSYKNARELVHHFRGYRLTTDQRPTFQYEVGDVRIEDFPDAVAAKPNAAPTLKRTLTLTAAKPVDGFTFRAAVADKIEPLADGWYSING